MNASLALPTWQEVNVATSGAEARIA